MTKVYNKLVRDNILDIITQDGQRCRFEVLGDKEFLTALDAKLNEELEEYNGSKNIEELADLVEVIYAILDYNKISIEDFETMRLDKRLNKGAFNKRIFLVSTDN